MQIHFRFQAATLATVAAPAIRVDERVAELCRVAARTPERPPPGEHASADARSRAVQVHEITHPASRAEKRFGNHAEVGIVACEGWISSGLCQHLSQWLIVPVEVWCESNDAGLGLHQSGHGHPD